MPAERENVHVLGYASSVKVSRGASVTVFVCSLLALVPALLGSHLFSFVTLALSLGAVAYITKHPTKQGGRGLATVAIVVSAAGLVVSFGLAPFFTRWFGSRVNEANIASICSANMYGVVQGLRTYAQEHDGVFPPDVGTLVACGLLGSKHVRCPWGGNYVLVRGVRPDEGPYTLLVYEPLGNHRDGAHVGLLGGDVALYSPAEYQDLLARYQHLAASRPADRSPSSAGRPHCATRPTTTRRKFIWADGEWKEERDVRPTPAATGPVTGQKSQRPKTTHKFIWKDGEWKEERGASPPQR